MSFGWLGLGGEGKHAGDRKHGTRKMLKVPEISGTSPNQKVARAAFMRGTLELLAAVSVRSWYIVFLSPAWEETENDPRPQVPQFL